MTELEASVRAASSRELPRAELAATIVARLEQLGAPPESIAAARKIARPKSVVVVAGQQPVLFGGPGLVWAKASDAVALARAIEEKHGVPAAAVFWNASEDHDHAECDHVRMDLGGDVETLRVPLPNDRRMLSRVPVPAEARALLETLRAKFPQGPAREEILAALEPAADDTMGSWFSRIVLRLLGRHGLVVVEPDTLRPFARAVVDHEIARPGGLAASIRRAESDAVARGEAKALELPRDELYFLVDADGRRLRPGDAPARSASELRALPASAFSWNVAARVLAQDVAVPVAAQVCGPSEIVYCARLASAHAALGVPAPALVERSRFVFITPKIERLCRELGLDPEAVAAGSVGAPPGAPRAAPAELASVRDLVKALPSRGSSSVQRRHAGLVQGVEAYAEALARDATDAESVRQDRWRRAAESLRPSGSGQDRHMSPLPWIARLGVGWFGEHVRVASKGIGPLPDGHTYLQHVGGGTA